ncbi:interleukin-23 receptor [Symphorus nematophorus]
MGSCPLLPADCQRFNGLGYLTVEPAPLFLIGSNLTVYCHITQCQLRVVSGLKLSVDWTYRAVVFPPDKPENIICETSRSSDFINCSWERGQETHISTAYNISVNRENGTQTLFDHIRDAAEITIPRVAIDENTKYQLIITAYNHFGVSRSDPVVLCVKDKVIPETPRIKQIKFGNNSSAAVLQWETTDSLDLRFLVRLRTNDGSWEVRKGTELSEGFLQVDGLKPLTEYEFQMRTCNSSSRLMQTSTARFTPRLATSKTSPLCSKWSPSVRGRSPGKGPAQQLHVWRMLGCQGTNESQMVTVLWKPPSPEDYSGEVQHYKVFLGNNQKQEMIVLNQCSVQVPAEVQALSISAVTLYGVSPPADVPLRHSGDVGPVLRELTPAANGSTVFVSWSWPGNKHWPTQVGGELLHYVLEWTSVPVPDLQWKQLDKDQNSTSITGLTAGVRYSISLYTVTTRGVSAPSSHLIYSKEQKPASGPSMSVLVHEDRRVWIQWDELPVDQQRGFITNYTIYVQALDSSNTELSETVPGSDHRQKWLNCPEGALALQLTASTSAGEGPRGIRVSSQPATPAVGLVIVIVFIISLFIAIIANLMCWSCARERIKQKCISWGPAWFDGKLPKPGNSIAIRLLEQDGSELGFSSTYSDPPLSPISLISQEDRDGVYPNVDVEISHVRSAETPLLISDPGTTLVDRWLEQASYKPQIATLALQEEEVMETEEEQRDITTCGEEDTCSSASGGFLGGFLSSVKVDFSDSPVRLTLSSVSSLLWPKTPETSRVLNGGFLLGRRGTENDVEVDSPSLDLQSELLTCDREADTSHYTVETSQYTVETTATGGYFPQVAAVSSTTVCDTQG